MIVIATLRLKKRSLFRGMQLLNFGGKNNRWKVLLMKVSYLVDSYLDDI